MSRKSIISTEEKRRRKNDYNKKYRQSEGGRAARKKWLQSENGKKSLDKYFQAESVKIHKREYMKKYVRGKGKKIRQNYNKSEAGKTSQRKYKQSLKGILRRRKTQRTRYTTDESFKLSCVLRARVRQVIKEKGVKKDSKTADLIGCTFEQCRHHLESKFKPGMSWENHGLGIEGNLEWHIDHIAPIASFDLTDPVQQKRCFHYTNLQPLWAHENLKKSDSIDHIL